MRGQRCVTVSVRKIGMINEMLNDCAEGGLSTKVETVYFCGRYWMLYFSKSWYIRDLERPDTLQAAGILFSLSCIRVLIY